MNSVNTYFSQNYLLNPVSGTKFELFYLIFSLLLILGAISYRLYLLFKGKRSEVYRSFDKLWFWGALLFGFLGLFLYFARTQALPTFSTRVVSYLWLLSVLGYATYLIFYFRTTIPEKLHTYYDKKRKSKYLAKK